MSTQSSRGSAYTKLNRAEIPFEQLSSRAEKCFNSIIESVCSRQGIDYSNAKKSGTRKLNLHYNDWEKETMKDIEHGRSALWNHSKYGSESYNDFFGRIGRDNYRFWFSNIGWSKQDAEDWLEDLAIITGSPGSGELFTQMLNQIPRNTKYGKMIYDEIEPFMSYVVNLGDKSYQKRMTTMDSVESEMRTRGFQV